MNREMITRTWEGKEPDPADKDLTPAELYAQKAQQDGIFDYHAKMDSDSPVEPKSVMEEVRDLSPGAEHFPLAADAEKGEMNREMITKTWEGKEPDPADKDLTPAELYAQKAQQDGIFDYHKGKDSLSSFGPKEEVEETEVTGETATGGEETKPDMGPDYPSDEAYKTAQDAIAAANAGDKKFTDHEMADKFKIIAKHEMGSGYRPGDEKTYMNLNYNPPKEDVAEPATIVAPAKTVATPTPKYIYSEGEKFLDKNSTMPAGAGSEGISSVPTNKPTLPTPTPTPTPFSAGVPANAPFAQTAPAKTPLPTPTYIHSGGETFIDKNSTMGPFGGGPPGH